MSNNQGKGGGQPADDRTLLDPLDADELKALREARQRLQGSSKKSRPTEPVVSAVGPDAEDDDIGDGDTRAMSAIPSFDSQRPRVMADPKPLNASTAKISTGEREAVAPEAVVPKEPVPNEDATVLLGKTVGVTKPAPPPAVKKLSSKPASKPSSAPSSALPVKDKRGPPTSPGFGENTLMWMEPVKAPASKVDPARGAAARGSSRVSVPAESKGRRMLTLAVFAAGIVVTVLMALVFLWPHGKPSVVELVTNPHKATVLINGKAQEITTPMKASLPPGTHDLEIRLNGYRTETFELTVVEGARPTRRSIELHPISKPGLMTVSIKVNPIAANITINGKVYPARTALKVPDVNPKTTNRIEIEAGGYDKISAVIVPGKLVDNYEFELKRPKPE